MKISVFFAHIKQAAKEKNLDIIHVLKSFHEKGIDGLEVDYTEYEKDPLWFEAFIKKSGLEIANTYVFFEFKNGCDTNDLCSVAENIAMTSCRKLMVIPGFIEEIDDREKCLENMSAALSVLCDICEKKGITVMLEDYDLDTSPISSVDGLRYFFDREERLRFTLDTGNFCYSRDSAGSAIECFSDKLVHVHLKDRYMSNIPQEDSFYKNINGNIYSPAPCGSGVMNIERIINKLKTLGYDGYLAIEHFGIKNQYESINESLHFIKKCISEPEKPLEIERKFLIHFPDISLIKAKFSVTERNIVQTYLKNDKLSTKRVRMIEENGRTVYVKTEKIRVTDITCVENEREISEAEYRNELKNSDVSRRPIRKTRLSFEYMGHTPEIDIYEFWNDRATLEIELECEDEKFSVPDCIKIVKEVTSDKRYKNVNLALEPVFDEI